ncbi:hypothetical protein HYE67_008127 [Fusarium culmorum]|uniref:Vegetative incompatibility protein HET-E-1 n=1 Tax=Fusarium culmorum TaxID=5516 RepID=A0A2T4H6C3_FUSCU|nr:Vegetative incompatibility protein HET-E-1 [Fusarium culmorum]QPC65896.1 hypothetical protein HYE67_008127 [Fusarium culmorum]
MWLLDACSLRLVFFANEEQTPPYAILSHTWSDGEVSFQDMMSISAGRDLSTMTGWSKIENSCRLALCSELRYVWIDTCCIDKSSSAELQEAINSMFRWYELASICFAYISDVSATAEAMCNKYDRPFRVLPACQSSVCVRVIAPGKDSCFGDIDTQWIAKPVNSVGSSPGLVAVTVQAVNNDDTARMVRSLATHSKK